MARLHANWIEGCPTEVGTYRVVFECVATHAEILRIVKLEPFPPELGLGPGVNMIRCHFDEDMPDMDEYRILRYQPVGADE